mgnify:CR=1 FL=1|tara:strand:+ start:1347 stop:1634 length:288 start_codon:yes stop_codon:yes gene_type:complete
MVYEILIIFGVFFIFGLAIDKIFAEISIKFAPKGQRTMKLILGKYRIHHNWMGYVMVILGLIFLNMFFLGIGLGMVVGHGLRRGESFWFLEEVKG